MIKIIAGKYGPKLLGPGTVLELSKEDESRLVNNKVAEYVTDHKSKNDDEVVSNATADSILSDNEFYLSEDEIKKMKSKQELVDYAASIGLEGMDTDMKKDDLVDAILNFIEENSEEESE